MDSGKGFSLIEVMVTLAIAAIVLSVGVPSFQSFIQSNRQTTAINELATALQLARSTAVSRRVRVTVCKSPDGLNCVIDGDSSDWSQGWIVFADPTNSNIRDDNEDILRVHGAVRGNATISGGGNTADRVAFKPQGMLASLNGTITYCDSRGSSRATKLVINRGGQVRFEDNGTC